MMRRWISVVLLAEASLVMALALGLGLLGLSEMSEPESIFGGPELGVLLLALGAWLALGAALVIAGAARAFDDGTYPRALALAGLVIAGLPLAVTVVGGVVLLSTLLLPFWRRPDGAPTRAVSV